MNSPSTANAPHPPSLGPKRTSVDGSYFHHKPPGSTGPPGSAASPLASGPLKSPNTTSAQPSSTYLSKSRTSSSRDRFHGVSGGQDVGREVERTTLHPFRHNYAVWFMHRPPGERVSEERWEGGLARVCGFGSIESFWSNWVHLKRPSQLPFISDYHVFKFPIRPVWEDPHNSSGGKWILRLKKGLADRYWEEIVLALVGETFFGGLPPLDEAEREKWRAKRRARSISGSGSSDALARLPDSWESEVDGEDDVIEENECEEICGVVLSVRKDEDILSVWNRDASEAGRKIRERIRDAIRNLLNLPPTTVLAYKPNTQSMEDRSSFRGAKSGG